MKNTTIMYTYLMKKNNQIFNGRKGLSQTEIMPLCLLLYLKELFHLRAPYSIFQFLPELRKNEW